MKEQIDTIIRNALALCDEENLSEAEEMLREALEHHPDDVNLLTTYGIVQSKLDLDEEAENTLRRALAIDLRDENAVCALGRLLDSLLRTDEAQELLKNHLREQPKSHCAVDDLCRILLSEGFSKEALELAEQHSLHYPKEVNAYTAMRYVLARIEDAICFEYEGDEDEPSNFEELFSILVKQFELILRMEREIGEQALRDADTYCDLQEDIIRLTGELEYLIERTGAASWDGKDSLIESATILLEIGTERRKVVSAMD